MLNTRFLILTLSLVFCFCGSAIAQPRSISKIVNKNTISKEDEAKIQNYAVSWAEQLDTFDGETLKEARLKLVSPFRSSSSITPYARSLYGKYLKEGFKPLLEKSNRNEMAAVNALQVVGLLGTEQGCHILLNHADTTTEKRAALRLWASTGLGTSFLTGELPINRVNGYAKLVSTFTKKETEWFVLTRLFDSLAALQSIPKVDRSEKNKLQKLSFELQTDSLDDLLGSITNLQNTDDRVRALPFVLSSLKLQLFEPSIDTGVKTNVYKTLLPPLVEFVECAVAIDFENDSEDIRNAYGSAVQSACELITRATGSGGSQDVLDLWNSGEHSTILELLKTWKANK